MSFRDVTPDLAKGLDGLPVLVLPEGTVLESGYVVNFLAVGGMSVAYRGSRNDQIFFVKEVLISDTQAYEALIKERSLLRRFSHPRIPRYVDDFSQDGFHYLVTDFVRGRTLESKISPLGLNEKVVVDWGIQICEVLHYLHLQEPPVIYRDLKPQNLMLSSAGEIFLVDFGVARTFKVSANKDTKALGTPLTASPEHFSGQTDARSDVFSLGATLHILLTGGRGSGVEPFEFAKLRRVNGRLSEGIEAVIDKALLHNANKRYASVLEFQEALRPLSSKKLVVPSSGINQEIEISEETKAYVAAAAQARPAWSKIVASPPSTKKRPKIRRMVPAVESPTRQAPPAPPTSEPPKERGQGINVPASTTVAAVEAAARAHPSWSKIIPSAKPARRHKKPRGPGRGGGKPSQAQPRERVDLKKPDIDLNRDQAIRRHFLTRRAKVNAEDLAVFTRQLVTMLEAGLPIVPSLEFYAKGVQGGDLAQVVKDVADRLHDGGTFSGALRAFPEVFDPVYVSMVETGEVSGRLTLILGRLADITERLVNLKRKTIAAVTYPLILVIGCAVCSTGFIYFILPSLVPLITGLGVALPWPTRVLLAIRTLLPTALSSAVGFLALWYWTGPARTRLWCRNPDLANLWWEKVFIIPVLGTTLQKIIFARILFTMNGMLEAGMNLTQTLTFCQVAAANPLVASRLEQTRQDIFHGATFGHALGVNNVFPHSIIHMIVAGEESASLSAMTCRVAFMLEEDVDYAISDLVRALEPLFLGGAGLVVGFIVLASMLPIVELLRTLR